MASEEALKKAVEHWQFHAKKEAVLSLIIYTFRCAKERVTDAQAVTFFWRKTAAKLLRILRLDALQRCAYSDGWRWARSTSIALGALARVKQINECSEKRLQRIKQAEALYQNRRMQRAFFGLIENASRRLGAAVQLRMAEVFHRRYSLLLPLFRLKTRHAKGRCSACRTRDEVMQRAAAHHARRHLARWRANIQVQRAWRRQRLQQHAEEVQHTIQQWSSHVTQRVAACTIARQASDWHAQLTLFRAIARWNSATELQRQARIQRTHSMYISHTNALATLWQAFVRYHAQRRAQHHALELAANHQRLGKLRQALEKLHGGRSRRQQRQDAEEQATILHRHMQLSRTLHRLQEWQRRKWAWRTQAHTIVSRAIAARQPRKLAQCIQAWKVHTVSQRLQRVVISRCEEVYTRRLAHGCLRRLRHWVRRCKRRHLAIRKAVRHRVANWNRRLFRQLIINVHKQRRRYLGLLKSTRLWKYRRQFQGLHAFWTFSQARKVAIQLRLRAVRIRRNALLKEGVRRMLAIEGRTTSHPTFHPQQLEHDARSQQLPLLRKVFDAWKQLRPQKSHSTRSTRHLEAVPGVLFNYLPDYSRSMPFIAGPAVGALSFVPPSDPLAKEPPRTASWLDDPVVVSPSPALPPHWTSGPTPVHVGNTTASKAANDTAATEVQQQLRVELATAIMQFVSEVRSQLQPGNHRANSETAAVA